MSRNRYDEPEVDEVIKASLRVVRARPYVLYALDRLNSIQARYSARQAMWERHQELLREYPDILTREGPPND